MSKFAIVEFIAEKKVAIVPSSWLLQSGKLCLWPPKSWSDHKITSAVKKLMPPQGGWSIEKSRRMSKCDTYKEALRRQQRCQYTSHCESTDNETEVENGAEKNRSGKNATALPLPPPGRLAVACSEPPTEERPIRHAGSTEMMPDTQTTPCTALGVTHEPYLMETRHEQHQFETASLETSPPESHGSPASPGIVALDCRQSLESSVTGSELLTPVKRHIIKSVAESKQYNREVMDTLQDMKQVQLDILHRLSQLHAQNTAVPDEDQFDIDDFRLPLKTYEGFQAAEKLLENKAARQTLVGYLSAFGGNSLDSTTRAIISRVMSPAVQILFNMKGRKGSKMPFEGTNMCSVVVGAIDGRAPSERSVIEQSVGRYLAGAKDRDGGRRHRTTSAPAPTGCCTPPL